MYIERPIGGTTKKDFSEDNQDYSKALRYLRPTELGSRDGVWIDPIACGPCALCKPSSYKLGPDFLKLGPDLTEPLVVGIYTTN